MSADQQMDAAEYVLGTLDREERAAFGARLVNDAEARAAVSAWEYRLSDLSAVVPDVAPSPSVWIEIERALDGAGAGVGVNPDRFKVIDGGKRGSMIAPDLRRTLNRWRAAALLSTGLAAALLLFIGAREFGAAREETSSYIAAVNRGGDKPALLVRVDMKTRSVYVRPVAAETPRGKSLELWFISGNKAPHSMGVVDRAPVSLIIPADGRADAATFAVSVEPAGGSKTGGPTGPVVYSGELIKD